MKTIVIISGTPTSTQFASYKENRKECYSAYWAFHPFSFTLRQIFDILHSRKASGFITELVEAEAEGFGSSYHRETKIIEP